MKKIILYLILISSAIAAKDQQIVTFRNKLDSAEKIIVRTGSYAYRDYNYEQNLIELTKKREIKEFKKLIRLKALPKYDKDELIGVCMCHGSHTVEVYSGDSLIFNFSIHHFEHIRYPKSLDVELTATSKKKLKEYVENLPIPSKFIPVKLRQQFE